MAAREKADRELATQKREIGDLDMVKGEAEKIRKKAAEVQQMWREDEEQLVSLRRQIHEMRNHVLGKGRQCCLTRSFSGYG